MTDTVPTRAALLELQEERRAMREGHGFLDEKCLLLAGEMMRQLRRRAALDQALRQAHEDALRTLAAALARHGLEGLQAQPPQPQAGAALQRQDSMLMGVRLQQAAWSTATPTALPEAVAPSPEAQACRQAHLALLAAAAPLAAVEGNLERLSQEYRRSVRRARALQDVLLPELEHRLSDIQGRLEEIDQQEAIAMRQGTLRG